MIYAREKCKRENKRTLHPHEHAQTLFHRTDVLRHFSDRSAWRQAAQPSPLFQFAVSGRARVETQCISINARF